jgi:hypothetical protein
MSEAIRLKRKMIMSGMSHEKPRRMTMGFRERDGDK